MFSALHNTINIFMQDLQVHLVQCLVHYLLHHGSTKELKVLPLYRVERVFGVINLSLTEKRMDGKKKLKFKI